MQSIERARRLRKESSLAEQLLWAQLRDRKLSGYKFRRQRPIDRYVADFVCLEEMLIVEVDGNQHTLRIAEDALRDARLATLGYRVLRVSYVDVVNDVGKVCQRILGKLGASGPSPPAPSPRRGEG